MKTKLDLLSSVYSTSVYGDLKKHRIFLNIVEAEFRDKFFLKPFSMRDATKMSNVVG